MNPRCPCLRTFRRGFTLVEMLASISVFAVVFAILAQCLGLVADATRVAKVRADNFLQARVLLGLVERDLQSAIIHPGLAAFVDDNGQSALAFYTRIKGSEGDRPASLVRYELEKLPGPPRLIRSDYGMDFGSLNRAADWRTLDRLADLGSAKRHEVVRGVLRFEMRFLTPQGELLDSFNSSDPSRTAVVVLSMLVMDEGGYDIIASAGKLSAVEDALSGEPEAGQTHGQFWEKRINDPSFYQSLPAITGRTLRVFERFIRIPQKEGTP